MFGLRFWNDEAGFVVSSEMVLLATVSVVGLVAGMTTARDQIVQEMSDVADAISEVNQSYSYSGISSHSAITAGSVFRDLNDSCEVRGPSSDQRQGAGPACSNLQLPAADEADRDFGRTAGFRG